MAAKKHEAGSKDWAIDRIKKCFARAKGTSSEHEAAIALRQAQKLMAEHGLSEDEVAGVEMLSVQVATDYEWPVRKRKPKEGEEPKPVVVPNTVQHVVWVIRAALGVVAVFEPLLRGSQFMFSVKYFGPRDRVTIAEHAHTVVARSVKSAWKKYSEEHPEVKKVSGGRASFYAGWCANVRKKVQALVMVPEELKRIEAYRDRQCGELTQSGANEQELFGDVMMDGADAAADFTLNRPVGEDRRRIGHEPGEKDDEAPLEAAAA